MIKRNQLEVFKDTRKIQIDDFIEFGIERTCESVATMTRENSYSMGARLTLTAVATCPESALDIVHDEMSKKIMHNIYGELIGEVAELQFLARHASRKEVEEKAVKLMSMLQDCLD